MKQFILLCGLTAAGVFGTLSAQAQTSPSNTAVVRIRESNGWGNVIVTYGSGQTEVAELKRNPDTKGQRANAEQLQALFDKLFAAGYVMQGSFTAGDENGTSTLVFRKP